MTRLEFTDMFAEHIQPLWPSWKPSSELIDLYAETFQRYESEDLQRAFRRHKAERDYLEPKIPMVTTCLKAVIGERKAEERKQQSASVWPGQVFVVVVHNPQGETERMFDFHIPNPRVQVPRDFTSHRMQSHIDTVKTSHGRLFPGCNFSGEILIDSEWQDRRIKHSNYWRSKLYG